MAKGCSKLYSELECVLYCSFFSMVFLPARWRVCTKLLEMRGSSWSRIWAARRERKGVFAESHSSTGLDTLPAVDNEILCIQLVMGSIKCWLGGSWAAVTCCVGGSLFSPGKLNWLLFSLEDGTHKRMLLPFLLLTVLVQFLNVLMSLLLPQNVSSSGAAN